MGALILPKQARENKTVKKFLRIRINNKNILRFKDMAREIKNVACAGGGVIGSSWAVYFAMKGLSVWLYDINDACVEKAKEQIKKSLDSLVEFGAIDEEKRGKIEGAIKFTTDIKQAVEDADLIQESGPERVEIKRSIIKNVESFAKPDAIISSSTSGLLVTDIAKEAEHPERIVGTHPYNPPHLIPLVEMTSGEKTDPAVLSDAHDFYQAIGKEAIILKKECPGYIANRLQLALYREVKDLVLRGFCSVEDADKALVYGPGIRWAIFGHSMIMQLGNPDGLTGMEKMLGNSGDVWLADMASWTHQPENWAEVAQPGVDEEMKNFPDYVGHTNEECRRYRDQMLIDILKLHKKF